MNKTQMDKELIEQLANLAHEQWTGWMEYLFSKRTFDALGQATITKENVERWQRQIKTKYKDLPENEKTSDRIEAQRVLRVIQENKDAHTQSSNI